MSYNSPTGKARRSNYFQVLTWVDSTSFPVQFTIPFHLFYAATARIFYKVKLWHRVPFPISFGYLLRRLVRSRWIIVRKFSYCQEKPSGTSCQLANVNWFSTIPENKGLLFVISCGYLFQIAQNWKILRSHYLVPTRYSVSVKRWKQFICDTKRIIKTLFFMGTYTVW